MLDEVSWGVTACHRVIAESGTYEPARVAAAAKIKAVADIRNAGVETVLVAIEKTYADAVTQATAQNFYGAERVMKEIPKQCDPLVAKAKAWKLYDDARKPAEAKLTEAEGHKAAASIQPMLTRLRAKYDAAVKQAEGGDAAGAQKAMTEILAAATNAIKTADTSAGFADDASKMGDAGPDPAMVAKAKAQLAKLTATPEAASSKPDLDEASKQLTSLDASGLDPTVAKAAFKAATDALTRAEMAQDQTRMLGANVKAAKAKIAELKAHAQAAYIAPETAKLGTEADDVQKAALAGGNPDGATANLETTMDGVAKALAMANAQAAYIKLRATPEVEPRLEVLEKHPHRYAIKANIDTIKTKLQAAADASAAKNPDAALTLLQEVRALGISSLVMADMRANKPPKVADVKAILAGPGGQAELDAMIEQMEPDAQRAVLRVAFEARFGCKLENFSGVDANGDPSGIVADMGLQGPNIKRFYEIMAELPPQDAVNNDSMRTFQNVEDGGQGSLYSGDKKKVVMREGSEVLSSSYTFGSEHEVGKVDPGCEPVDDKEVNFFSWNTMHEVGHAVDDKHSFMDKNGTGPAYGGWTTYGRNVKPVADVLAKQFAYDARYIGQYLAHATSIALPPAPTGAGAVTAEEWEKRRIAVCAWVDMAGVGNNPWASNALAGQLAIGGVVYHESYANSWSSYSLGARAQGMTGYQFRAPGEWFAELYAAFHAKKLKPAHPAYGWISAL